MRVIEQLVDYLRQRSMLTHQEVAWLYQQGILYTDPYDNDYEYDNTPTEIELHLDSQIDAIYEEQDFIENEESARTSFALRHARGRRMKAKARQRVDSPEQLTESSTLASLARAMTSPDAEVRTAAATLLARTCDDCPSKAVPNLVIALADANERVRLHSAAALASLSDVNEAIRFKSRVIIVRGLDSTSVETRRIALDSVALITFRRSAFALPFLLCRLRDADAEVRESAHKLVDKWRRDIADDRCLALLERRSLAHKRTDGDSDESFFQRVFDSVLAELRQAMHGNEPTLRFAAARMLYTFAPNYSAELDSYWVQAVSSDDSTTSRLAIQALSLMDIEGTEQLATAIVARFADSDWTIRRSALKAFAAIGPAAAGQLMAVGPLLRDQVQEIRLEAIEVLGRHGGKWACQQLQDLISRNPIEMQLAAIATINYLGFDSVSPLFPTLLRLTRYNTNGTIQTAAFNVVLELVKQFPKLTRNPYFLETIRACSREQFENTEIRLLAKDFLRKLS